MTPSNAWRVVAERAQSTVASDEEQTVLCDALGTLAAELGLTDEYLATDKLRIALRARAAAQLEFSVLLRL